MVQALLTNISYFFSKSTNVPYRGPIFEKFRNFDPMYLIEGAFLYLIAGPFFVPYNRPCTFRSDWSYFMNFRVIGVIKSNSTKISFCRN